MKKIVYLINNAGFFVSHRLPLAEMAIRNNFEVHLITGMAGSMIIESNAIKELSKFNIKHHIVPFTSQGVNPIIEIANLFRIILLLKKIKPDVIHAASPKGVLLSCLANLISRSKLLILSISGMGFLYAANSKNLIRSLIKLIFISLITVAINLRRTKIVVQNTDDLHFWKKYIHTKRISIELIPGSGVDMKLYEEIEYDSYSNTVLFPSRLIYEKGIIDFVDASKILSDKGYNWRFILAGTSDYESPGSVEKKLLDDWINNGHVEWIGHQEDMRKIYEKTAIVCLPSFREGMPKVLLEAAACSIPIVTTDTVGCREAIINEESGLLVPLNNPNKLADAIEHLIKNPEIRRKFGKRGRELARDRFSLKKIKRSFETIYREI